jgi:hypothetical protein
MRRIVGICAALMLTGCGYANLDTAKENACTRFADIGYQCVGYEGFNWGFWLGGRYGGAKVWYSLKRADNPTVIYTGYAQYWGSELHIYGPAAIDAIRGTK